MSKEVLKFDYKNDDLSHILQIDINPERLRKMKKSKSAMIIKQISSKNVINC